MTWRMFLGGPADRQWINVDDQHNYRVAGLYPAVFEIAPSPPPYPRDVTYTRERYHHPAWRIVLTFYVTGNPALALRRGDPMPGWVHGVDLEQSRLCRFCRAEEAQYGSGLGFSCYLDEGER